MKKADLSPFLVAILILVFGVATEAQQPTKAHRIGFIGGASPAAGSARIAAFRQGLRELGYVDGTNIAIEERWAEGNFDRMSAFVAELVRLKVEIIVTGTSVVTRLAKEATVTIPIVMTGDSDPVGSGTVASLARPGGNITGLSTFAPDLSGKRLALLKETVAKLSHVAILGDSNSPGNAQVLKETEVAARAFGVKLQYLDVLSPKDIETAFRAASKGRVDAVLVLSSPVLFSQRAQITDLALKNRLPALYGQAEYVDEGGLMSYGVSGPDLYRRAATYVDKILKGRTPADLPVEQPTTLELVINMKTAKALGLTIPPNVLVRAQKIIN